MSQLYEFMWVLCLDLEMAPYLRTSHVLSVTVRQSCYGWVCVSTELLDPLIALLACCCSLPVCKTRLGLCYPEPGTAFSFALLVTSPVLVDTGLMRFCWLVQAGQRSRVDKYHPAHLNDLVAPGRYVEPVELTGNWNEIEQPVCMTLGLFIVQMQGIPSCLIKVCVNSYL